MTLLTFWWCVSAFEANQKKQGKKDVEQYGRQLEDEMQREQERHKRNLEALSKRKEEMIKDRKQKLKVETKNTFIWDMLQFLHIWS